MVLLFSTVMGVVVERLFAFFSIFNYHYFIFIFVVIHLCSRDYFY